MSVDQERQQAHAYLDRLPPAQLSAVRSLLEAILDPGFRTHVGTRAEDEEIGEDEEHAVARSKDWFQRNEGIPFERVVAELGFTMEQIRSHCVDDDKDRDA